MSSIRPRSAVVSTSPVRSSFLTRENEMKKTTMKQDVKTRPRSPTVSTSLMPNSFLTRESEIEKTTMEQDVTCNANESNGRDKSNAELTSDGKRGE